MKIDQHLVDRIVEQAKKTRVGLGDGLDHKNNHLKIGIYYPGDTPEALALCLISAYDNKYDLVAIMQATVEILTLSHHQP